MNAIPEDLAAAVDALIDAMIRHDVRTATVTPADTLWADGRVCLHVNAAGLNTVCVARDEPGSAVLHLFRPETRGELRARLTRELEAV